VKAAEGEYRKTCAILDKIACTSTLHRNTASRRKSRLARRLNALKAGGA
jgi:ribosomal protein S20